MATIVNDRDVILQAASPRTITLTMYGFTVEDATTALANAATAQAQADTATANAATAQSQANTATANAATAQSQANTATANAATAQAAANAANTALTNIASDSILSPSEKPSVVQDYSVITTEQSGIDAQATAYLVTTEKTNYDSAVSALTTYLGTLTGWNTVPGGDVVIVGATFRSNFANVYTTKQLLLDKIVANAKSLADTAQAQANTATTNAATAQAAANAAQAAANAAQTAADNAQTSANAANADLANIASDSVLSRGEKAAVILDYTAILNEQAGIDAQADAFVQSRTAYDTAVTSLTSYLTGLAPAYNDTTTDTVIVAATFRSKFTDVYSARQVLLDAIASAASTNGKSLGLPLQAWKNPAGYSFVTLTDGHSGSAALRMTGSGAPNTGTFTAIDPSKTYRTRFWARSVPTTNGLLYFDLRQFIDSAGATAGPVNGGRSPYKPGGISRSVATDTWTEYSYTWGAADWQAGVQYVQPEFLGNYSGTAGYWEIQDFTFEEVTEVVAAQAAANAAQTTANTAETNALAALSDIANIASDSVLSAGEKPRVVLDYTAILNAQTGIDSQATTFGATTKGSYDTAVSALTSYLTGLSPAYNSYTTDTTIVEATFRGKFTDVYLAQQVLLNEIASIASGGTLLGSGVVGTSKIAGLAVDTPRLADYAATGLASLTQDFLLSRGNPGTEIFSNTLSFTTVGRGSVNIMLSIFAVSSSSSGFNQPIGRIYVDGSLVSTSPSGQMSANTCMTFVLKAHLTLASGAHTCQCSGQQNDTFGDIHTWMVLSVEEVRV